MLLLAALTACWTPLPVTAENYCEITAGDFCDFYLRCGRLEEETHDACVATFLESCNTTYEPHYVALEQQGMLTLSEEGLDACVEHLESVACDAVVFDLDGGCADMWQGEVEEGGACSFGIESFVCDADTTCILDLTFCGTCEPAVSSGEVCGDGVWCAQASSCVDGFCVTRGLPGDGCDDEASPCVLGASCLDGVCVAPTWVAVGDECDGLHQCPYNAECLDTVCVKSALQGESCVDRACATGVCEDGLCVVPPAEDLPGECF